MTVVSYFMYKVGFSKMDIANLILSFIGVIVLLSGDSKGSGPQEELSFVEYIIPSIVLVLIPVTQCAVQL